MGGIFCSELPPRFPLTVRFAVSAIDTGERIRFVQTGTTGVSADIKAGKCRLFVVNYLASTNLVAFDVFFFLFQQNSFWWRSFHVMLLKPSATSTDTAIVDVYCFIVHRYIQ